MVIMKNSLNLMRWILRAAAVYNLLWGAFVILFPQQYFLWADMQPLNHPMVWQGMGMVVGVYGLGYWWASSDPHRHWPIIAVGFMGKIFGPAGFFINYLSGDAPFAFMYTLITNDFLWWIPFGWMLIRIYKDTRKDNYKTSTLTSQI
jgi:hypothetical protein